MPHCRTHRGLAEMKVNDLIVKNAQFDYWGRSLQWFDYWLKGKENGALNTAPITYFLIGADRWETAEAFPPRGVEAVSFYLSSDGNANTATGDGVLQREQPVEEETDTFVYDPSNPVRMPDADSESGNLLSRQWAELGLDHAEVEQREDVLVYTTARLTEALKIVGHINVELFVSSSAKDTDFTATLLDVQPDGRPLKLHQGIKRARFRDGYENPEMMNQGEVYRIPIEVQSMAYVFKPGHRIRLEVSSSAFPRWERNMNRGGNNYDESHGISANNTVHHGLAHPSALVLPVMRPDAP